MLHGSIVDLPTPWGSQLSAVPCLSSTLGALVKRQEEEEEEEEGGGGGGGGEGGPPKGSRTQRLNFQMKAIGPLYMRCKWFFFGIQIFKNPILEQRAFVSFVSILLSTRRSTPRHFHCDIPVLSPGFSHSSQPLLQHLLVQD